MVRTFKAAANEYLYIMAVDRGNCVFMGNSVLRVYSDGTCKQNWLYRERRTVYTHSTQGDTGGYLSCGIHSHCRRTLSGTAAPLESCGRLLMSYLCRLLCFSGDIK